jgi:hypothetical protein
MRVCFRNRRCSSVIGSVVTGFSLCTTTTKPDSAAAGKEIDPRDSAASAATHARNTVVVRLDTRAR